MNWVELREQDPLTCFYADRHKYSDPIIKKKFVTCYEILKFSVSNLQHALTYLVGYLISSLPISRIVSS